MLPHLNFHHFQHIPTSRGATWRPGPELDIGFALALPWCVLVSCTVSAGLSLLIIMSGRTRRTGRQSQCLIWSKERASTYLPKKNNEIVVDSYNNDILSIVYMPICAVYSDSIIRRQPFPVFDVGGLPPSCSFCPLTLTRENTDPHTRPRSARHTYDHISRKQEYTVPYTTLTFDDGPLTATWEEEVETLNSHSTDKLAMSH